MYGHLAPSGRGIVNGTLAPFNLHLPTHKLHDTDNWHILRIYSFKPPFPVHREKVRLNDHWMNEEVGRILSSHTDAIHFYTQKIAQVTAPCHASSDTSTSDYKNHAEDGGVPPSEVQLKKWRCFVLKIHELNWNVVNPCKCHDSSKKWRMKKGDRVSLPYVCHSVS